MASIRSNYLASCWWLVLLFSIAVFTSAAEPDLQLIEAAKNQEWENLRSLLETEAVEVNTTQPDGTTALAWTVYWDHVDTIKYLLAGGADPNIANDYGVSPLIQAIQNRSNTAVKMLLGSGTNPNATRWDGVTPLMMAAKIGVTEVIESLLAHHADINAKEPRRGQNALMWAISFGQPSAARILIENGADISTRTKMLDEDGFTPMVLEGFNRDNVSVTPEGGYTPLMFAARAGDLDTATLLLSRGANVNEVHSAEATALVIAAEAGHEDVAIYLLEHGAEPNQADDNGMTALHYAMRDGLKVVHGVSVTNATQMCGFGEDAVRLRCKPLEVATEEEIAEMNQPNSRIFIVEDAGIEPLPGRNMLKLAEALLTRGVDPNARMKHPPPRFRIYPSENSRFSTFGATPFLLAAAAMDITAVDLLLEHGADPMMGTEINEKLLAMQVEPYDPENRVNPEAEDNHIIGTATPLMVAMGMGRFSELSLEEEERALDIAEKLLSLGVDINATSVSGWTALHGAVVLGANNLIEFLAKNGADLDVQTGCGLTPLDLAKGEKSLGLMDVPKFNESTTKLLISLGAKMDLPLNPVGECILGTDGRLGLPLDLEFVKKIREMKKAKQEHTANP